MVKDEDSVVIVGSTPAPLKAIDVEAVVVQELQAEDAQAAGKKKRAKPAGSALAVLDEVQKAGGLEMTVTSTHNTCILIDHTLTHTYSHLHVVMPFSRDPDFLPRRSRARSS